MKKEMFSITVIQRERAQCRWARTKLLNFVPIIFNAVRSERSEPEVPFPSANKSVFQSYDKIWKVVYHSLHAKINRQIRKAHAQYICHEYREQPRDNTHEAVPTEVLVFTTDKAEWVSVPIALFGFLQ